ncbi:MAG: SDR family oxidoreductase [Flavobacteriaceae bacterium]|nr:SDR family oxidoreductase [Flavobacteriaceae bacterium]
MILQNKTAIITGVSKGIGHTLAKMLLEKGCKVAGLGMNKPDFSEDRFQFFKTDVRNHDQVKQSIEATLSWAGKIDILVNNAGLGYFGFLEDLPIEHWQEMMEVNVNGMFYACKYVLPHLKENQHGHIINIASTAALEGMPQTSGYCATKWAVKGLTESLWRECRDFKVKVTCVYPGSTQTDFFRNAPGIKPHEHMLQPEDVALMIVHALEAPDNCHQVNIEVRPLQPKGPK